jgi:hypothetical protein
MCWHWAPGKLQNLLMVTLSNQAMVKAQGLMIVKGTEWA